MTTWAGTALAYRRSFARACAGSVRPLLEATGPTSGRAVASSGAFPLRHLDVGCGDGRLAAAAVEADRRVTACDADAGMCALTGAALPTVVTHQAALPDLPYDTDSFDAVTANFVINHVDEPQRSVEELTRVCAPGGMVAGTVWPAGGAGFGALLGPVFGQPDVEPLPDQRLPARLDFDRTPEGLSGLFAAAGLAATRAAELHWTWHVSPDDLWAGIAAGIATPGQTYLAQNGAVQRRIEEDFFRLAAGMSADGVLTFQARCVLATGTKPA